MNPYYEHDGITLYHGDAREILPHMKPVHLIVTDPPYHLGLNATAADSQWADLMNGALFFEFVLQHARRLTALNEGAAWIFNKWKGMVSILRAAGLVGWSIDSTLIWDRDWPNSGNQHGLRNAYELVSLFRHDGFRIADRTIRDIWKFPWTPSDRQFHPAEKPVALLERLIEVSDGNSVLDPFAGSGLHAGSSQAYGDTCRWYRDG